MYIRKVLLEDIRCFKKLEIEFPSLGESALIAADNGDGKTTLLQSIAMGLCDESSAAALFRELPGRCVRQNAKEKDEAKITLHLEDECGKRYGIETIIQSLNAFERVHRPKLWMEVGGNKKEALKEDDFPWGKIFACGYGAGRQVMGGANLEKYATVDAVYTLFRYYEPLQSPELAVYRLVEKERNAGEDTIERENRANTTRDRLLTIIKQILNLDEKDEVSLAPEGIVVKAHWGSQNLACLGDGHKAMTTCVLDLLSCQMLAGRTLNPQEMTGIVLIDEIEQHLHPSWQIRIMDLFHEIFPKIQFIATTHSPLVVSGCKFCKVLRISRGQCKDIGNMYGWLAEDVYREVMDLADSRSQTFKNEVLYKFEELHKKELEGKASSSELEDLKKLRKKLAALPESDPIGLTTEIRNITDSLRRLKQKGS